MTIGRWVFALCCLVALAAAAMAWRLTSQWDEARLIRAVADHLGQDAVVERPRLILVPSPRVEIDRIQSDAVTAEGVRLTPHWVSLLLGRIEPAAIDARTAVVSVRGMGLVMPAPSVQVQSLTVHLPSGQRVEALRASYETREGQRRFTLGSSSLRVEGTLTPGSDPAISATVTALGSTARLSGVMRGQQLDGRVRAEIADPKALLATMGIAEPPGMLRPAGVLEGDISLDPTSLRLTAASYVTGLLRLTGHAEMAFAAPQLTVEVAVPSLVIDHLLQAPGRLGGAPQLPVHLRLTAETARWRGGPVRGLVLEAAAGAEGIRIPWAEAHLPGDLHLAFSDGRWTEDRLEGRLEFGADDLRRPLGWWLGAAPALPAPLARDAAGIAVVDWTPRRLVLRDLDVSLGDSRIDGAATLGAATGDAARPRLDLLLRLDQLTLPDLPLAIIPDWDGRAEVVIQRLTVGDVALEGVRATGGGNAGVMVLDQLSAMWEGRNVTVGGTLFAAAAPARFAGHVRLGGAHPADITFDLSPRGVSVEGTIDWHGQPMLVRGPLWPRMGLVLASRTGSVSATLTGVDPTEVAELVAGPLSATGFWRGAVLGLGPAGPLAAEGRSQLSLEGQLRSTCPLPLVLARCLGVVLPDGVLQATVALPQVRLGPLDASGGSVIVSGSTAAPMLDITLTLPTGQMRVKQTDRDGRRFLLDTDGLPLALEPVLADLGVDGLARVAGSVAVTEAGASGAVSGTAEGVSISGDLTAMAEALAQGADAAVLTALSRGRTSFARAAVRLEVQGDAITLLTLTAAGEAGQIAVSQEGDVVRLLVRAADAAGRVVEQRWTRAGGRAQAVTLVDGVVIAGQAP
ncbi:MAG: hypothetical protein SF002_02715 [Alphaproteobacteria bacterium]|nr:hypothetical protein [Alphaproteobacteria bacterium]